MSSGLENHQETDQHPAGRRRAPDHVALRRPLRSADDRAVGARRGPRAGGPAGRRGRAQHPRVDREKRRPAQGLRRIRDHGGFPGPEPGRLHRRAEEPGAGAGGLRAGLGGRRSGHQQPGELPGAGADPRARHARAARHLLPSLRAAGPRRGSRDLARRLRPDRADPLRRRRNRPARRQGARGRVGGRRGAHPAGGQARPLHHQHGLRQLRHRRRGLRRPAHQGQLHGHPGGDRSGHLRPRHAGAQAGPSALLHARSGLQPARARQPHHRRLHGEGRRHRPELQPRRDHRGGLPAHPRHRGPDDLGQAALGRSSR